MTHHRYSRILLDLAHQRIAPARDDKVDVPVLREQRGHFGARLDGLYKRPREGGARKGGLDRARQFRSRARRLFSSFQDGGVAYARRTNMSSSFREFLRVKVWRGGGEGG